MEQGSCPQAQWLTQPWQRSAPRVAPLPAANGCAARCGIKVLRAGNDLGGQCCRRHGRISLAAVRFRLWLCPSQRGTLAEWMKPWCHMNEV